MMNMCENCRFARLVVSEDGRKDYVGCIKTDGYAYENENNLLNFLDSIKYTGETVASGRIYTTYPNQKKPENGHMISTCLMVEKNAKCKFFEER